MGDYSAGFHVGRFAYDPNAELRRVFEERDNQQDGLVSILKYCQEKSGFMPGNIDTARFSDVLDAEFSKVVTHGLNLTNLVKPSGNYNRAIAQFMTEEEGDFLTMYVIDISMYQTSNSSGESVRFQTRSVDRDEMARTAEELVVKLREKERLENWAKGMSSAGYQ